MVTAPLRGLALGVFLITVGMQLDLGALLADWPRLLIALVGVLAAKALVTATLLWLSGSRKGTAAETGLLMASPSETTLILLGAGAVAGVIAPDDAAFWQAVTALGLTVTPLLAATGRWVSPPLRCAHPRSHSSLSRGGPHGDLWLRPRWADGRRNARRA